MELDRLTLPLVICADPSCEWARLADRDHFDRHNPPCAHLFVGHDGTELICDLTSGHRGPHRGVTRRPSPG